jgi:putative effector of murein hydrolase LrgA (UPF0299 family)
MNKSVRAIARASWWQVGLLIGLGFVSLLDMTVPRVVGGIVLLALALAISVCKLLARREEDDRSTSKEDPKHAPKRGWWPFR